MTGVIVCHFEAQSLDDQGRLHVVALRIDRVLEPVVQNPSFLVTLPLPAAGELLTRPYMRREKGYPRTVHVHHLEVRPWTLKFDAPTRGQVRIRRLTHRLQALYEARQSR